MLSGIFIACFPPATFFCIYLKSYRSKRVLQYILNGG